MYRAEKSLPHLNAPEAYVSLEAHGRDQRILEKAWHLVASRDELAGEGDFVTCELLGRPIQVRNFAGELHAISNVCAHRHCLLTKHRRGRSASMRCQYHGWEYRRDGRPCKIPAPSNFIGLDKESVRLPVYRVQECGQLVFVCLSPEGPDLTEHLGPLANRVKERFGAGWKQFLSWEPDYLANWKVPLENSLEAYHVDAVHPLTFGRDPGEQRSVHVLEPGHTAFATDLPFVPTRRDRLVADLERFWLGRAGLECSGRYWQHHLFPNLLFSFTDSVSLCHCILPTGPERSRAVIHQFGPRAGPFSSLWGRLMAANTRLIMAEDLRLFESIQKGLRSSPHPGLLGRCEERIHAFQQYLQDRP